MKTLISTHVASLAGLKRLAVEVLQILPPQAVVLLSGDVGSGKTTFVSFICAELGIPHIQSPTYAIHNQYPGIDHFDLYRLESRDQLEASGFFDLLEESKGFCFIEWPERLRLGDLPLNRKIFEIVITLTGGERDISVRALD